MTNEKKSFLNQFRERIKSIDEAQPIIHKLENLQEKPKTPKNPIKPVERLFNVHKLSLPVGLDKVVAMGLTLKEAEALVKVLKPRSYQDDANNNKTVIYYDLFPQDSQTVKRNLFLKGE